MNARSAALGLLLLSACIPYSAIESSLRASSAKEMGCPAERVEVADYVQGVAGGSPSTWTARGCDREWSCELAVAGSTSRQTCKETPASEARTTLRVAQDRLQLETNCPADRVKVVRQAEWRAGTETAYRFEACGKDYICTASAGRVSCKPALAE